MLTIYCGIFFLSDHPEIYTSNDFTVKEADNGLRLSESVKLIFFVLIVVSNTFFMVYWCFKMYKETKIVIMKKNAKIYTMVCLCGDKNKYEREIKRVLIEEENELLREDYMKSLKQLKKLYTNNSLLLDDKNIEKI